MKLNLDERLAKGVAITYTHENRGDCPAYIQKILAIPGVSSVFRVEDFMAIQRKPTAGWEDILSQARALLEYTSLNNAKPEPKETSDNKWREVTVAVQYFRDLPMLVKVSSGSETTRLPLPERFGKAIERAMGASENMLMERKWKNEGLRYGELREVGEAVVREISAVYDEKKLKELVERAYHPDLREKVEATGEELGELVRAFESPQWEERFAALKELGRNATAQIDSQALSALREAQDDREFEVAMQIRQAIERIESGKAGQGPVWRQMTTAIN